MSKQQKMALDFVKNSEKEINFYLKLIESSKKKPKIPRDISFKSNKNKQIYEKTKELVVLSYKQYYLAHKLFEEAKKKNVIINDPVITKLNKLYLKIKTKILPYFDDNIEKFGSYIGFNKLMTVSLDPKSLSDTYELILKQTELVKKSITHFKKELKKQYPNIKLEESNDLLEADIKEILKAPFIAIKKAMIASIKIIFEGWMFVLKSGKRIAIPIKKKFDYLNSKFNDAVGKAVKNIILKINPDFLETAKMLGITEDDIVSQIGSIVKKGLMFIILSFTFTAGIAVSISSIYFIIDKMIKIGAIADTVDMINDMFKMVNDDKFTEMIANL